MFCSLLFATTKYSSACIALSISYGGPGPHFLCESIARYLCNEPVTTPELDVPDYEVRERIEKVRVYHVYVLIYSLKQQLSNKEVFVPLQSQNVVCWSPPTF